MHYLDWDRLQLLWHTTAVAGGLTMYDYIIFGTSKDRYYLIVIFNYLIFYILPFAILPML